VHFIVFDACRNNLGGIRGAKGFVPVAEKPGMLIAFSTAPGAAASDEGKDSGPYAAALATELVQPGLNHGDMFFEVRTRVARSTAQEQIPWTQDGLMRRVHFGGEIAKTPEAPPRQARLSEAAEAWDRTKDATSVVALEAFIRRFGDTYYGDLAKARLKEIKGGRVANLATPRKYPDLTTTDCQPTRASDVMIQTCSEIIARFPTFAMAYALRGDAYRLQRNSEKALPELSKAPELDPQNTLALAERFIIFKTAGENAKEQADIERLLAINPTRAVDFAALGLAYAVNKNFSERRYSETH